MRQETVKNDEKDIFAKEFHATRFDMHLKSRKGSGGVYFYEEKNKKYAYPSDQI